jgi:hypothetical protein
VVPDLTDACAQKLAGGPSNESTAMTASAPHGLPMARGLIDDDDCPAHASPRHAKSQVTSHAIPHAALATRACIYRANIGGRQIFFFYFAACFRRKML